MQIQSTVSVSIGRCAQFFYPRRRDWGGGCDRVCVPGAIHPDGQERERPFLRPAQPLHIRPSRLSCVPSPSSLPSDNLSINHRLRYVLRRRLRCCFGRPVRQPVRCILRTRSLRVPLADFVTQLHPIILRSGDRRYCFSSAMSALLV